MKTISELLSVDEKELRAALCSRVVAAGGDIVNKTFNGKLQAMNMYYCTKEHWSKKEEEEEGEGEEGEKEEQIEEEIEEVEIEEEEEEEKGEEIE